MLTPIVTSLAYCFPQTVMGLTANEEPKNQENDDDDDDTRTTSYDDFFFDGYFTDAFDTVDHDADDSAVSSSAAAAAVTQDHSNAALHADDDQSLLCDIESLTSSDEYSNRSIDSRFHFGGDAKATEVYEEWISNACRQLNIMKNPLLWDETEVRSWCEWALSQYQVRPARRKMLMNNLHHNGISFSQLQEKDFTQLFRSAGVYLYAELELWKNATEISSTDLASVELMALGQTGHGVTSTNSRTHCPWSVSQASGSQDPVNRIPTNTNNSNDFLTLTLTDKASFGQESRQSSAISDNSSVDVNHTSITSDSFDSTSSDCHSSWSKIPTFVLESVLCDDSFADSSASGEAARRSFTDPGRRRVAIDGPGSLPRFGCGVGDNDSSSSSAHSHFAIFHKEPAKVDPVVCSDEWEAEEEEEGPYSSKHGHQLWQFLQELLRTPSVYEDCIRWIDRHRGIFKIEDSVRVAKLWGQRKNRPAMNYDKLSRSIRQYYKKGIIQKTSESRRLVYQFCPKYNI